MVTTRQLIQYQVQRDWRAIVLYIIVLIIMTYPLAFRLGEIIPMHNPDTYTAMWQNWWVQEVLVEGYDLNQTSFLFYPNGLDISLQPRRWTSYPLWAGYHALFGNPSAYNLTVLTQTLIRAYAMYCLILLFVPNRSSAWVGGAFFAFSARNLSQGLQQPNSGSLEFIPIFMIFFVMALRQMQPDDKTESSVRTVSGLMILSAIAFSANVYMNLKIGIFAMLIGGGYILWVFLRDRLWRVPSFWYGVGIFSVISGVLCLPLLASTLTYDGLSGAINQYIPNTGIDAMIYIKHDIKYPLFFNHFMASFSLTELNLSIKNGLGAVGFISISLAATGAYWIVRKQREQLIWIVQLFVFFSLSLGVTFLFNGRKYPDVWLPYRLLIDNPLFIVLRDPERFQMLMIFAQSILVAFGIYRLYITRGNKRWFRWMLVGVTVLMLFETSIFPIPYRTAQRSEAYAYITEHHQGAIISMPMGRHQAKYAMYNQIFHQQPIHEGMIARMPADAYDYVESSLLLRDMADINNIQQASDDLIANWDNEIDRLLDDGFRYVVVHRLEDTGTWILVVYAYQERMFFMEIEPDFETDTVAVYDLQKLRGHPPLGDPFAED